MKVFKLIISLSLLVLTVGFLKLHESETKQSQDRRFEEVVLEIPSKLVGSEKSTISSDETISIDYPDEEIRVILRNVADLHDLNLVIPERLKGRTSLKLSNVTWRQIFEVILQPFGYTYVEDHNIIRIKSLEELVNEPVDTRVFIADYINASDLEPSILPLIDTRNGGRIQVDIRSNALVITERPSRMNKIQDIIQRLDRATDQVAIEVKLFEVIQPEHTTGGTDETSIQGTQKQTDQEVPHIDTIVDRTGEPHSPQAYHRILNKLKTNQGVRQLTSFNIITLDDEAAKISTSEEFAVPNYVFNEDLGIFEVDGVKSTNVGISFSVHPKVNSSGFIRLDMTTEISQYLGNMPLSMGEDRLPLPLTTTKSTTSKMMVKDGFTLSVGGMSELISQDVASSTENHIKHFVLFVTAKTLNPDGATYRDTTDMRVLHEMEILESELPGYHLPDEQSKLLDEIRELKDGATRKQATLDYQTSLSNQLKQKTATTNTTE
ncbi:MAG: secretin N-terminal domain-containing protein [Opitutaceae bacterium]